MTIAIVWLLLVWPPEGSERSGAMPGEGYVMRATSRKTCLVRMKAARHLIAGWNYKHPGSGGYAACVSLPEAP